MYTVVCVFGTCAEFASGTTHVQHSCTYPHTFCTCAEFAYGGGVVTCICFCTCDLHLCMVCAHACMRYIQLKPS